MNRVKDFFKLHDPLAVRAQDSVMEVARLMTEQKVGAVLVLDGDRLAGVFTERDLMNRVVSGGLAAASTVVGEVMTTSPLVVDPETTAEQCMRLMNQAKCRHLPVISDGKPVGMISIRDLLLHNIRQKDNEIEMMRAFIHDVPPSTPKPGHR